jgi:hypothetical protein
MQNCITWIRTSGGLRCKIIQVEFCESFLKIRTSGIRNSWDRTSGGPAVLCLSTLNWFIGHLGRATCTYTWFLPQTNQERIRYTTSVWDPTKKGQWMLHIYSIANFVSSWLKWLQMIWNDSKWVCMCLKNELKSFEFISNHLESWGDKNSYTINNKHAMLTVLFCRVS